MSLLGRELTMEEREALERLAGSQKTEHRLVVRAGIILAAARESGMMAVCRAIGKDKHTVRTWVDRYLARGIDGLHDLPRCGHPCVYTPEQRAEVVRLSLTHPNELGLPLAHWTFTRLADYMHEVKKVPISRSRIAEVLEEEGLRWHHEEGWYGKRLDPAFVEKRGPSSGRTVVATRRP